MKRILQLLGSLAFAVVISNLCATTALAETPKIAAAKTVPADSVVAAQALLDEMQQARFEAVFARFDANMQANVSVAQLKAVWESLPPQMGALQQRGAPTVASKDGITVVSIPLLFAKGRLVARIASDAGGKVIGFLIQPDAAPAPPARTDLPAREVAFGPAGRTLPGTVLLPKANAAKPGVPAVVLVHGSGPQDRDETIGGTRVFRDLAEGLADRGIASLRYEKRTKARPQDFIGRAFTMDEETTDDAIAAVVFLRTQPGIDPARIFVIGHSQGAMMAPQIARTMSAQKPGTKPAPPLAGLVLMAAPARPLEDILLEQNNYLAMDDGRIDEAERTQLDALKRGIADVKKIDAKTPSTAKYLLDLPASYWRSLQGYDPVAAAKTISQPLLILQGDRDFQVTAPDWQRWQSAFRTDPRATIKRYPTLNHLFVAGTGRSSIAEYSKPAHVASQVTTDIADWIQARK